jgi:PAS domain S-box-containing protein
VEGSPSLFMGKQDELRRLAVELEAAEAKLRVLTKQLPMVMWTVDRELRFTSSLGAGLDKLGRSPNEVSNLGMTLYDYFGTEDSEMEPIHQHLLALQGESGTYEFRWLGRLFQTRVEPLRDNRGEITGAIGVALDVTEQAEAERALASSEQRYRELAENAADIIYSHDLAGNLTSVNRAAERITGYSVEELQGMNISQLLGPEDLEVALHHLAEGLGGKPSSTFELGIVTKDGRTIPHEVRARLIFENGKPVGAHGVARDIAERKQLEEQLRQAQKMEAVGTLAGGLAHDFNNVLTGILGYTDLLRLHARPGDLAYEAADIIESAAERAAELTGQLLGFARRGKHQNVPVNVHETLRELAVFLRRTIPTSIVLREEFASSPVWISGDPNQIYQAFLNLALNARDAMSVSGVLTFRTEITGGREPQACISVIDTGVGIPPENRSRIFDPFFTTKSPDAGTGMGLPMVYGIVRNHGGTVEVESEPGLGATFRITLPLAAAPEAPAAPAERASVATPGSGRILVVDDDDMVCQVLALMLRNLGYEVESLTDPHAAVERYRTVGSTFALVIIDMVMPKMGGRECFHALRAINPRVKAILTTGYAQDGEAQEALDEGIVEFLRKPCGLSELAETVARALGESNPQNLVTPN